MGGIALGADTRATEGSIVADKNCEKVSEHSSIEHRNRHILSVSLSLAGGWRVRGLRVPISTETGQEGKKGSTLFTSSTLHFSQSHTSPHLSPFYLHTRR